MEFYENTEKKLSKIESNLIKMSANKKLDYKLNQDNIFFDNQEFMQLMNISKRTSQQWRDNKIIGFSQVGNKIYYRLSDIQKLLEENYKPKKEY
jgi:hypothetical protein